MEHESEAMKARRKELERATIGLVIVENLFNGDENLAGALDEAYDKEEQIEALKTALVVTLRSTGHVLGVEPLELATGIRKGLNELQ